MDNCNNIGLFCSSVWYQQTDRAEGDERNVLPCQSSIAVVYGGFRHDRCFDIGRNVCECAWYGDGHRHDLYADVLRLYIRLYCRGVYSAADVLQAESDNDLFLSGAAVGTKSLQDGCLVLSPVEDDGGCGAVLRGVYDSAQLCVRGLGCAFPCYGDRDGGVDMALYARWGHQNVGMDGHLSDTLSVLGSPYYYI